MFYIIGLFLIIGLALGAFTGSLPFNLGPIDTTGFIGDIFSGIKNRALEYIFPKSKTEILIDNLSSNYDLLDRFFSGSSETILNSADIPESTKEEFKKVLTTFNETKRQVSAVGATIKNNQPGVLESLIKKALNIGMEQGPEPTSIPPNCNLVCRE